jgi:hypothetical protein
LKTLAIERTAEAKFDVIATGIATKIGYKTIPWLRFSLFLTYIYTVLTLFVTFYRPDFYNVREYLII